jgi:hypothetical protein
MAKYVFEVLQLAAKQRLKEDKIRILRENESWALKDVLRGTFDSGVVWNLPAGEVPYTPAEPHNHPANLLRENVRFKYCVKGIKESDDMPAYKRERIFLGMLESVHPKDAEILVSMINKKPPKYITRPIVEEAFPGLLQD